MSMLYSSLFAGGSVTAGLAIYDTMQVDMCWKCTIYFYLDKRENYLVIDNYHENKILTAFVFLMNSPHLFVFFFPFEDNFSLLINPLHLFPL